MKQSISQILSQCTTKHTLYGENAFVPNGLALSSREVEDGFVFFAVKGTQVDGNNFIQQAIENGAKCIVSENDNIESKNVIWIQCKEVAELMGEMASAFYDHPSQKLKLVGVTGTNGKSSVVTMLYQLFSSMGQTTGLISTIGYVVNKTHYYSTHTTPNSIRINELLDKMVRNGCTYCFMEVSSIAVHQSRVHGIRFEGAVFTNLTHDHLDYHGTFSEYIRCKKLWFDNLSDEAFALVNIDDKNGKVMVQNTKASVYSYSLQRMADFKSTILETDLAGTLLKIEDKEVWVRVVGEFNAYNLTAVYGVAFLLGFAAEEIITQMSLVAGAKGRFERIAGPGKRTAIVDYAHTPDALENVLQTIQKIRTRNETLLCVFGCGGNRDKAKRPIMGKIAASFSDRVILTSDNPRDEIPTEIIQEIKQGIGIQDLKKVLEIEDRKQAIRAAVAFSKPGDVILIAGKGHENYQEIKGVKIEFDDIQVVSEAFKELDTN